MSTCTRETCPRCGETQAEAHECVSQYDKQASEFLIKYRLMLSIRAAATTPGKCPPWQKPGDHCSHGLHYKVTLFRPDSPSLEPLVFDFWGSQHDAALGAYDVLACLGSDSSMPDDPDEVLEEFGPMKIKQALACVEHGRKVRAFCRQGHILLDDLQAIA